MIQAEIQTKASPESVWQAWERAHRMEEGFHPGQTGTLRAGSKKGFSYRILDVQKGKGFSILWKTFFVRLVFSHAVAPCERGSRISYSVDIRGLFAWPMRWFLSEKIRKNLELVLKSLAAQLDRA